MSEPTDEVSIGEGEAMVTYPNNNFQAINNSIMLVGSYSSNDPGVHMDMSEQIEPQGQQGHRKERKYGRKGKKKERGTLIKSSEKVA
uniref:Uncharacterized protein n=1 Tax=Nelumbo nucifera TaxID=4432 RepID=A0A822XHY9_NELNU|nr:TPA_asm: hypothetical protein HUJ06_020766 [Nelumbo nucifera]